MKIQIKHRANQVKKNDTEIFLGGLRAVSDLVSTNQFNDMESLSRLINGAEYSFVARYNRIICFLYGLCSYKVPCL